MFLVSLCQRHFDDVSDEKVPYISVTMIEPGTIRLFTYDSILVGCILLRNVYITLLNIHLQSQLRVLLTYSSLFHSQHVSVPSGHLQVLKIYILMILLMTASITQTIQCRSVKSLANSEGNRILKETDTYAIYASVRREKGIRSSCQDSRSSGRDVNSATAPPGAQAIQLTGSLITHWPNKAHRTANYVKPSLRLSKDTAAVWSEDYTKDHTNRDIKKGRKKHTHTAWYLGFIFLE
jgi:hypothetical protein